MPYVVVFLAAIGVSRALFRLFSLAFLPGDYWDVIFAKFMPDAGDIRYSRHAATVLAHAIPALLYMTLAPFQFVGRIRAERPRLHRWLGRVCVAAGMVFGAGGLALGFATALGYGGPSETAATMALAGVLLFSLARAFVCLRRGEVGRHREWMIRAFSMALTAGTVTIVGMLLGVSAAVRSAPRPFVGVSFWVGFTINLMAAEVWINYTRFRDGEAPKVSPVVVSLERQSVTQ